MDMPVRRICANVVGWIVGVLAFLGVCAILYAACLGWAIAQDRSHCGPDGFSPPAPPEMCEVHTVPEPGSLLLLAIGGVVAGVVRKVRRGNS